MANPYFNAVYYLQQNPDVFAAGYTVETAWDHYAQYGANEAYAIGGATRAPNPWFDAKYYLNNNPDLIAAGVTPATALDHFFAFGGTAAEDRAPNATIAANPITEASLLAYAKANADLLTAFGIAADATELTVAQQNNLITQFYAFGYSEERPSAPTTVEQPDPNQGETFTLTTAPDNVQGTAGDDTVNGYINTATSTSSTLTAADVVDGKAGTDSMYLTVEGAAAGSMAAAAISNVENFFIRDVAGAASKYDFSAIQGEQQVWSNASTNAAGVDFQNLGTGATVGLKGNNVLDNLGDVTFNMATAADAVSIAIDGGVKDGSAGSGTLTKVTASAGAATEATISSSGAANTVGAVTLSGGTNTVKTLTVNATTNLTAALVANDFAADAKLVVTGEGKVSLGANFDGNTIDASANSGGLTISTTTGVTKAVTGSSAADSVTLVGSLTSTGSIDLGAGNDKLLVGTAAAIAGTNTIDGGAGTDSISASLINAANAAAIKNFELLDLSAATTTSLDVELVTGSAITGLSLAGGTGGATVTNVAAGVGLSVSGNNTGTTTIGVKGASTGTTDAFTTTIAGTAASTATAAAPTTVAAGTVVTEGIEALSIVSGGTGFVTNTIAVTDANLKTLAITGDKDLGLTFTGTNGTNGATGGAVSLIDGSAATGKLSINTTNVTADSATAGLTVKGGSAADTITLVGHKATVDAGAGNDTIVTAATFGGTLTGGAGNDKFDVSASVATGITEATAVLTTVTDFTAGDSAKLLAGSVLAGATLGAKTALDNTVTNIDTALQVAGLTDVANEVSWFQYGSNTYLVANDATVGFAAGDLVVKLTGLIDLSGATLDTTTDYLTLA